MAKRRIVRMLHIWQFSSLILLNSRSGLGNAQDLFSSYICFKQFGHFRRSGEFD
jgi:hypothetical protein